jgi:hypothetical protein
MQWCKHCVLPVALRSTDIGFTSQCKEAQFKLIWVSVMGLRKKRRWTFLRSWRIFFLLLCFISIKNSSKLQQCKEILNKILSVYKQEKQIRSSIRSRRSGWVIDSAERKKKSTSRTCYIKSYMIFRARWVHAVRDYEISSLTGISNRGT